MTSFTWSLDNSNGQTRIGFHANNSNEKRKPVGLTLEPVSLCNYELTVSNKNENQGPLTAAMLSSPGFSEFSISEFKVCSGPLTNVMLQSSHKDSFSLPFNIKTQDIPDLHSSLTLPDLPDVIMTGEMPSLVATSLAELGNFSVSPEETCEPYETSVSDHEQHCGCSTESTYTLDTECAGAPYCVGQNQFDRLMPEKFDRVFTTCELVESLMHVSTFPKRRQKHSETARRSGLQSFVEEMKHSKSANNGELFCQFAGCVHNYLGFKSRRKYLDHVQNRHYHSRYICPWCVSEFSRPDALIRHKKRVHGRERVKKAMSNQVNAIVHSTKHGFMAIAPEFFTNLNEHNTKLLLETGDPSERLSSEDQSSDEPHNGSTFSSRLRCEAEESLKSLDTVATAKMPIESKGAEIECNSRLNYLLQTDPEKESIRQLLLGNIEEVVESCGAIESAKTFKPRFH